MKKESWYLENPLDCPLVHAISVIGGKWKPVILHLLQSGTYRFGEIKKQIPPVTQKMLTQQLKELEADGVVLRCAYAEVPPRVEYCLTDLGQSLALQLNGLYSWGKLHQQSRNGTKLPK